MSLPELNQSSGASMPNPLNSGPNGDGSRSLAKESKAGLAVGFILTSAATIALDALAHVDISSLTGWWVPLLAAGIGSASGVLTAWLKRNR